MASSAIETLLSCVRKEHNYVVEKAPAKPIRLIQGAVEVDQNTHNDSSCGVCRQHYSRYTCPRCSIGYCSMDCYKLHGGGGNNNNTSGTAASCTQNFYRDRTVQSLDLQVKERLDDTKQSIQRMYKRQIETEDDDNLAQEQQQEQPESFSQEALLGMMRCLEEGDESVVHQLLESEHVRRALEESLEKGELQDCILDKWTPWWRPEIESIMDQQSDDVVESNHQLTLDERLLQVPPLSKLLHPNVSSLPDLRYNLVDILYAAAWTLRLYHGAQNAMENAGMDAGETLLEASAVLSNDARWGSLPEVLSSCSAQSTQSLQNNQCNTSWSCLAQDVALICENRRFVGKALLETSDILRLSAKAAKRAKNAEAATKFRKGRKKIEFFLSWCREESNIESLNGLSKRIEAWSSDWTLPENESKGTQGIRLGCSTATNNNKASRSGGHAGRPMLVEVSSRKKEGTM